MHKGIQLQLRYLSTKYSTKRTPTIYRQQSICDYKNDTFRFVNCEVPVSCQVD